LLKPSGTAAFSPRGASHALICASVGAASSRLSSSRTMVPVYSG